MNGSMSFRHSISPGKNRKGNAGRRPEEGRSAAFVPGEGFCPDLRKVFPRIHIQTASRVSCREYSFGEAVCLRGGQRILWGITAIALGLIIVLALVLPSDFWWFALAALLIAAGIWTLRCC